MKVSERERLSMEVDDQGAHEIRFFEECEHGDRCSQLPPSIQFGPQATATATAAGNCEFTLGLDRRIFVLKVCAEDQLRAGSGESSNGWRK